MNVHVVDVDGVDIFVEDEGKGRPVVLLHGFTGCASTMADLGARLGPRRQLRIDLVGHGSSAAPPAASNYSMAATTAQVVTVIEELAGSSVDLIGYSFGARVALSAIVARQDLVRSAALIGVSPGLASAHDRSTRIASDEALADSMLTGGLEAFVDAWMALPMWDSLRAAVDETWWAESRAQRIANDPTGLANSLRGAGTGAMPPLFDQIGDISIPVELIVGELDTKFGATAQAIADLMPAASVSVVPGVGHAAHIEAPDAVAAIVRSALA